MEKSGLIFRYDKDGDILHIDTLEPYPEQQSEEMGDDVIARLNPRTGQVENLEVLFYSSRLDHSNALTLPIHADLQFSASL